MNEITRATVLRALQRHIGKGNGVTARDLVREITGDMLPNPGGERALRHIVEDLRREGHHIGAHPRSGYFICETDEELNDTCLYLYDRAMCSLKQVSSMKNISLPDLKGQLKLPT